MTTEKDLADQLQATAGDGDGEPAGGDDLSQVIDALDDDRPGDGDEGSDDGSEGESREEGPTVEQLAERLAELERGSSAKDTTITQLRDTVLRQEIDREIADAEAVENQHREADAAAVAAGEMTAADASKASRDRQEAANRAMEEKQQERLRQQQLTQGEQRLEAASRLNFAKDLAEEHSVDVKALLADPEVLAAEKRGGGPAAMRLKARELALQERERKAKGTTKVDSGRQTVTHKSLDDMSAMEKVHAGLREPIRERRR